MNPKISIIIPVYNAERYLRQCLDSVVNQTLRDIQVICVNDGSTDNSLAILREYEARDPRIMVLDQQNRGQSAARNATYPHIRGKYIMFVDSDDWIDLDTCEKCFETAEQTGDEVIVFFYQREMDFHSSEPLKHLISPGRKITPQDKASILFHHTSACWKFWRSDFLLCNNLVFPEGLVYEDNLVHWQAVTQAKQITVLPKPFYHYRENPDSTTQSFKRHSDMVTIYNMILSYLRESGYYHEYKEFFIPKKLTEWKYHYDLASGCSPSRRPAFLQLIRESLTEDDRAFYRSAKDHAMGRRQILFYRGYIERKSLETIMYYFFEATGFFEKHFLRPVVKSVRTRSGHRSGSKKLNH